MSRPWPPDAFRPNLLFALLFLAYAPACFGEDEPKSPSDSSEKPIKVAGTFEAIRQIEVSADNDLLAELTIERALPFGTKVTKGQTLVWFETKKLDQKIETAETDLKLAALALEADEFDYQQFLRQQSLDKTKAKQTREIAQQEFDNYQKIDRERTIKQAKFSLESAEFFLESATEEFRQLEQMYQEDDLTEESEEIVLRRAKRAMKSAAFSLERTKIQTERTLKQSVPRSDASEQETLTRAIMAYEKSMQSIENERRKRDLELQRKKSKFKEQEESFEKMTEERKKVVLKSEIDGLFLHGKLTRSKLPAKPVELKKGVSASGKQVLGTVVDPAKLRIRVDLPEQQFHVVRPGISCKVVPKGMPSVTLDGVVKSVGAVPFTNGKFDCIVNVRGKRLSDVMPTMTCDLLFDDPDAEKSDKSKAESKEESQ
jgi:hypothetical protein